MKRIVYILLILMCAGQVKAQGPWVQKVARGNPLVLDSVLAYSKFMQDVYVMQNIYLKGIVPDSTKVLNLDASGKPYLKNVSGGGGTVDTTVIATKYYVNKTVTDTAASLRAQMVLLFSGYYTKTQVDNFFTSYYTKTQSDALLAGKSDISHTHAYSSLTGIPSNFTPASHTHPQSDITNLTTDLSAKKPSGDSTGVTGYETNYDTDTMRTRINTALAGKANTSHTHAQSDITNLTTDLANKSDISHTHTFASLTSKPTTKSGYGITDVPSYGDTATVLATKIDLNGYVPTSRTITINGTAQNLSANRTYTIPVHDTSLVVLWADTADKIATKTNLGLKLNIADTSAMLANYIRINVANASFVSLSGSYSNPSWITSLAWSKITGTPTTKSGYGITDVPSYGDTATMLSTKTDSDSLKNALKYVQLNNIITSAPLLDNIIMDGDTATWDKSFREIGNCIYWPKIGKWIYMYAGFIPPYNGDNIYLGVMTSTDLKTWSKVGTNGKISTRAAEDPFLIVKGDSIYAYAEDKADVPFRNIRLFVSADGVNWTDKGDVLDIGTTGAWDSRDVSSPVVKQLGDTVYMWYEGRASGQLGAIGMATSTDMYHWTKYGANPVITGTNLSDSTFNWATHVVCHDIEIVNDDIYLFVTPYVTSIPDFVQTVALGSITNPYKYTDYLGTWFTGRRDINVGGQQFYANNRYYLMSYDKTATKLTMIKFQNSPISDFVNKPIITDDSIRARYLRVKNVSGYTATIYNAGTADRNDTLPDKSGTIAMTSDIQTYINGYGINKTGNTFSADTSSANGLVTQSDLANATPATPTLQQVTTAGNTTTLGITVDNLTADTVSGDTASGGDLQLLSTTNATKGKIRFGANSYYDENLAQFFIGGVTTPTNTSLDGTYKTVVLNNGNVVQAVYTTGIPIFISRKANGTLSSPTVITNNQILNQYLVDGYDGSNYVRGAEIRFTTSENWTTTATGTIFSIRTSINGTTPRTERIGSDGSGNVILNSGGGTTIARNKLLTNITVAPVNNNVKDYTYGSSRADDTSYADEAVVTAKLFANNATSSNITSDSVLRVHPTTKELVMIPNSAGGGGTPAGSGTEVQYRNGSSFGASSKVSIQAEGYTNVATTAYNGTVTTPSTGGTVFTRSLAGTPHVSVIGNGDAMEKQMQAYFGTKRIGYVNAGTNALTQAAIISGGMFGNTGSNLGGTISAGISPSGSTLLAKTLRIICTAAASTNSSSGVSPTAQSVPIFRSNTAYGGGFEASFTFGITTTQSACRYFVGFATATPSASADPSAATNIVGIAKDAGDANIQWISNDGSGTATKSSTGVAIDNAGVYRLFISSKPNSSTITMSLIKYTTTGVTAIGETTISSDLPAQNTGMIPIFWVNTGSQSSAVVGDMINMYVETDF